MNPNSKKCSVFITGATGFVGSALVKRLLRENVSLYATVLAGEDEGCLPEEVHPVVVKPLSEKSDYSAELENMDTVIHLAARVHIMQDTASDPLLEFRRVNLYGTQRLARQAAGAGVKRFIFMSTIGVNGNSSGSNAFTEEDRPAPHNPYSITKLEAEVALREIGEKTGMEVVIARAPLVYGPGNPGNFLSLLHVISKGIPLPLASIQNKKSFLYVENLADALVCYATHPQAVGQTFIVSDGEDITISKLIRQLAIALDCPIRLFPLSPSLLRVAGRLTGKVAVVDSLLSPLVVDSGKSRRMLGWRPPFTLEKGLLETAQWFREQL